MSTVQILVQGPSETVCTEDKVRLNKIIGAVQPIKFQS